MCIRDRSGSAFSALREDRERAAQGQLAAGGLTRGDPGGSEIAGIGGDLALALEDQLFGRQAGLANQGLNATSNLAGLRMGQNQNRANLINQRGQIVANGLRGEAEAQSSGILGDAQADAAGRQNNVNTALTAAGIFFSDPRLKQNMEPIGRIADLTLYEWDWIPEVVGTIVTTEMMTGFNADEVKALYPHHVEEWGGFNVINYPTLLEELQHGYAS